MAISGDKSRATRGLTLMDQWRLANSPQPASRARRDSLMAGTALGAAVFAAVALSPAGADAASCEVNGATKTEKYSFKPFTTTYNRNSRDYCGEKNKNIFDGSRNDVVVTSNGDVTGDGLAASGRGSLSEEDRSATLTNDGKISSEGSSFNGVDVRA